jgi:transposase
MVSVGQYLKITVHRFSKNGKKKKQRVFVWKKMVRAAAAKKRNTRTRAKSAIADARAQRARYKRIDRDTIGAIRKLDGLGSTQVTVAKKLGVSRQTVARWANRDKDDVEQHFSSGRPVSVTTPAMVKELVAFHQTLPFNSCTSNQMRAKFLAHLKTKKAKCSVKTPPKTITDASWRSLMKKADLRSVATLRKPEGMAWHAPKRLATVKERKKWSTYKRNRIIWIDQSCGQRAGGRRCIIRRGQAKTIVLRADTKGEKVHFMIGISANGWKSPIEFLPVRRAAQKDAKGNTVHRTLKAGTRRPLNRKYPNRNKKLNLPNEGETWTAKKILSILSGKAWLPHLQAASGVVIDAQSAMHKSVIGGLMAKGVRIMYHPPCSPDLNLVENVHSAVKNENSEAVQAATTNHELRDAYKHNWKNYDVADFKALVGTFPGRLEEIEDKKGGPARF